jgi:hypothetical protein
MQAYKNTAATVLMDYARRLLKTNAILNEARSFVAKDIREEGVNKVYKGFLENVRIGRKLRHDIMAALISTLGYRFKDLSFKTARTFIKPANFPIV